MLRSHCAFSKGIVHTWLSLWDTGACLPPIGGAKGRSIESCSRIFNDSFIPIYEILGVIQFLLAKTEMINFSLKLHFSKLKKTPSIPYYQIKVPDWSKFNMVWCMFSGWKRCYKLVYQWQSFKRRCSNTCLHRFFIESNVSDFPLSQIHKIRQVGILPLLFNFNCWFHYLKTTPKEVDVMLAQRYFWMIFLFLI